MADKSRVSDTDLRNMLVRIHKELMSYYPFTSENSEDVDARYCMTMGFIVGNITECIAAVDDDRPIRLNNTGFKEIVLMYSSALEKGNKP